MNDATVSVAGSVAKVCDILHVLSYLGDFSRSLSGNLRGDFRYLLHLCFVATWANFFGDARLQGISNLANVWDISGKAMGIEVDRFASGHFSNRHD